MAELTLKECSVGLEQVNGHVESLLGLGKLQQTFQNVSVVWVQKGVVEVSERDCFVL